MRQEFNIVLYFFIFHFANESTNSNSICRRTLSLPLVELAVHSLAFCVGGPPARKVRTNSLARTGLKERSEQRFLTLTRVNRVGVIRESESESEVVANSANKCMFEFQLIDKREERERNE